MELKRGLKKHQLRLLKENRAAKPVDLSGFLVRCWCNWGVINPEKEPMIYILGKNCLDFPSKSKDVGDEKHEYLTSNQFLSD